MHFAPCTSLSTIARLLAFAAITATCSKQVLAQDAPPPAAPYGRSAPADSAVKTVTITDTTRWVNVEDGATVTFVHGGKTFTWCFDTLRGAQQFPLSMIAPDDGAAAGIVVYVGDNPLFHN